MQCMLAVGVPRSIDICAEDVPEELRVLQESKWLQKSQGMSTATYLKAGFELPRHWKRRRKGIARRVVVEVGHNVFVVTWMCGPSADHREKRRRSRARRCVIYIGYLDGLIRRGSGCRC